MTDGLDWIDSQMNRERRIQAYWLEAWLLGRFIRWRRLAAAIRRRGGYARRHRLG